MFKNKSFKVECEHSHDLRGGDSPIYNDDSVKLSKCMFFLILGKKRSWTTDEDAYLIKLVQKYGAQKWTSIA